MFGCQLGLKTALGATSILLMLEASGGVDPHNTPYILPFLPLNPKPYTHRHSLAPAGSPERHVRRQIEGSSLETRGFDEVV